MHCCLVVCMHLQSVTSQLCIHIAASSINPKQIVAFALEVTAVATRHTCSPALPAHTDQLSTHVPAP